MERADRSRSVREVGEREAARDVGVLSAPVARSPARGSYRESMRRGILEMGNQTWARTRRRLARTLGIAAMAALAAMVSATGSATAASGVATSLDQCINGPVSPLTSQPCVGSNQTAGVSVAIAGINGGAAASYKNWVNGNANGSKAHWREGEFIAYRTLISGLAAGTHTLVIHYDTVHSGGHALDYLGSYDATETTSPATQSANGQIIHADNNSPCADLVQLGAMPSSQCGTTYNAVRLQTGSATPV